MSGWLLLTFLVVLGWRALPPITRFLCEHGMTARNYLGDRIPVGSGVLIAILYAISYTCRLVAERLGMEWPIIGGAVLGGQTAAVFFVFAIGWLDDSNGAKDVKGFKGHWNRLRTEGTVTSGIVKAAGIAAAALWVVLEQGASFLEAGIGWLTIVLSANAVNLLDVRPGRALKSFAAAAAVLLAASPTIMAFRWLAPAIAAGIVLLPGDLKGKHMLGDCGANTLGFALGCALAAGTSVWTQGAALAVLAAVHWKAETGSITQWIERHRWARWLDRLGRI